jgi:SAM-dependent methyltransferase
MLPVFNSGETDFRLCTRCGVVARERFPTADELDEIYRQAYAEEKIGAGATNQESGDFAVDSYADFMLRALARPGMQMLDYGAASGALVERLRRGGVDAEGMEFAADAREYCLSHRGFDLMASLDGVPPGRYQAASMIEVIEHLTDLRGALAQLHHVLAPGGLLLVTTPNRNALRARIEGGHWREAKKKFHLFLFDRKSLRYHLEAAGFEIVRSLVFGPLQRPGFKFLMAARLTQAIGMQGALCMIAKRTA